MTCAYNREPMRCLICNDETGPFEIADIPEKKVVAIVCEKCAKKIEKERKKKHDTACI